MTSDELKFGVGHARVSRQPGDRLMTERVGSGRDASLRCVVLHDLLDSPGRVPGVTPGLEQPTVVRMGGDVRPQRGGERSAEQYEAVFIALSGVDPNLVVF